MGGSVDAHRCATSFLIEGLTTPRPLVPKAGGRLFSAPFPFYDRPKPGSSFSSRALMCLASAAGYGVRRASCRRERDQASPGIPRPIYTTGRSRAAGSTPLIDCQAVEHPLPGLWSAPSGALERLLRRCGVVFRSSPVPGPDAAWRWWTPDNIMPPWAENRSCGFCSRWG